MVKKDAFKAWFKGSKAVDHQGQPLKLFHGTLKDFSIFKKQACDLEAFYGNGFYFSNSAEDVAQNYAGMQGADFQAKLARKLEHRLSYEDDWEEDEQFDRSDKATEARILAEDTDHLGATLAVFISIQNPFVIGSAKETFLDFDDGLSSQNEYGLKSGALQKFIESLKWVMEGFSAEREFDEVLAHLQDQDMLMAPGVGSTALLEAIRKCQDSDIRDPATGDPVGAEIIRQTIERCGYDGIVDHDVFERFGVRVDAYGRSHSAMGAITKSTTHYVAFNSGQIKSAISNCGAFDSANPDIRFSIPDDFQGEVSEEDLGDNCPASEAPHG